MKTNKTRRGAFTLVEMLVVVGIIALLAGIAFPVFSRVREGGRRVSCTSNLKQLGMAFQLYTQDTNGRYPGPATFYGYSGLSDWTNKGNWVMAGTVSPLSGGGTNLAEAGGDFAWRENSAQVESGAIFPYAKSANLYYCPSNKDGAKKKLSYSMNCALGGLNSIRIKQPSEIVLLVDEEYANDGYFYAVHDPGPDTTDSPKSGANFVASTDKLTVKHNGGGNLLMADGSVQFVVFDSFPLDDTEPGLENKWRDSGNPRFHDRSFGRYGSNGNVLEERDYCNAKFRNP